MDVSHRLQPVYWCSMRMHHTERTAIKPRHPCRTCLTPNALSLPGPPVIVRRCTDSNEFDSSQAAAVTMLCDWEGDYLASKTRRHIRALDDAQLALDRMQRSAEHTSCYTGSVRPLRAHMCGTCQQCLLAGCLLWTFSPVAASGAASSAGAPGTLCQVVIPPQLQQHGHVWSINRVESSTQVSLLQEACGLQAVSQSFQRTRMQFMVITVLASVAGPLESAVQRAMSTPVMHTNQRSTPTTHTCWYVGNQTGLTQEQATAAVAEACVCAVEAPDVHDVCATRTCSGSVERSALQPEGRSPQPADG